jgi:hypothetical protein
MSRSQAGTPVRRLLLAGALACCLGHSGASNESARGDAGAVRLVDEGGVCDGVKDNSAALARALARARELRLPVLIPAGQCAYADIIRVDGVSLVGSGPDSVLHALDWRRSAIFMVGAAPRVANLRLTGVAAPSRQADWEMTRITVFGATDFAIDGVTIDGAAAAGIQTADGATRGRITNNVVRNTLSDGMHLSGAASHILVEGNLVESTGDDGIAVVSYWNEGRVSNITARDNVVRNNRSGRNMSVVGGTHVLYENNFLQNNLAGLACLYIAQEKRGSTTRGSSDITARRNTLENCGGKSSHAAVMLFSDGLELNERIRLVENDIRPSGQVGIRVFSRFNVDVQLDSNRVTGAARPLDVRDSSVSIVPYTGGRVGYARP